MIIRSILKSAYLISCHPKLVTSKYLTSNYSSTAENKIPECIEFFGDWPNDEKDKFINDMILYTNFLTIKDEESITGELEPYLKRMKYEFDHWDDAIHGFRETERKHWYPDNKAIIQRIKELAFKDETIPYIHVLDLAQEGVIKPHVDSTRYCGTTIAGISLLSDSVMRLVRTDEKKYQQGKSSQDDYRSQPSDAEINENKFYANVLLKRMSLYIMKDTARYNFTHEILGNDKSYFKDELISKSRRISVICRNEP